jgi:hypothetical protein
MSQSNPEVNSSMKVLIPFLDVFKPKQCEKDIHYALLGKYDKYEWPVKYLYQSLVNLSCLLCFILSIPPKLFFLLILNACSIIQDACNKIANAFAHDLEPGPSLNLSTYLS